MRCGPSEGAWARWPGSRRCGSWARAPVCAAGASDRPLTAAWWFRRCRPTATLAYAVRIFFPRSRSTPINAPTCFIWPEIPHLLFYYYVLSFLQLNIILIEECDCGWVNNSYCCLHIWNFVSAKKNTWWWMKIRGWKRCVHWAHITKSGRDQGRSVSARWKIPFAVIHFFFALESTS